MVFEIIGSKLLAPFVGTSTLVWSNIIGVVLVALALGYYLGGRYTQPRFFKGALLMGSAVFMLIASLYHPMLSFLDALNLSHGQFTVAASLLIFLVPSFLLAFIAPYISEKIIEHSSMLSRGIGESYMIGSLGGIIGTFGAASLLIPFFGVQEILFSLGVVTFSFSLIFYRSWYSLCIIIIGCFLFFYPVHSQSTQALFEEETPYGLVRVFDVLRDGEKLRELYIDNLVQTQQKDNGKEIASQYSYFYNLGFYFHQKVKKTLMIGGGGYAYPNYFAKQYPDISMDIVEINPILTEVAKDFFEFEESENMHVFHDDGRVFLKNSSAEYDVILMDAFNGFSLPEHLSTKEFAELVYERLSPEGIIIINAPGSISGNTGRFVRSEIVTYQSVFPYVDVFLPQGSNDIGKVQNVMIIARKSNFENQEFAFHSLLKARYFGEINIKNSQILTDNYSPVENMNRDLYEYFN
ncbi:MAG: spermidine synthase [Candidatus Paceibacteria bacterium]|jgi:spermidine synthase